MDQGLVKLWILHRSGGDRRDSLVTLESHEGTGYTWGRKETGQGLEVDSPSHIATDASTAQSFSAGLAGMGEAVDTSLEEWESLNVTSLPS